MPNPWDVFSRAPLGDADAAQVYHAVGLALSNWEILETALAAVYTTIINSSSAAAIAAYGTIMVSSVRIDMIEAAAAEERGAIDTNLFSELKVLIVNEVGRLAGRRNEIAHGSVVHFISGVSMGHYLVPAHHNTRKQLSPRQPANIDDFPFGRCKYAYTAAQILQYADIFFVYMSKVYDLLQRIAQSRQRLVDSQKDT